MVRQRVYGRFRVRLQRGVVAAGGLEFRLLGPVEADTRADRAVEHADAAVAVHRETGYRLGEAARS
jgi:hypothetical protein